MTEMTSHIFDKNCTSEWNYTDLVTKSVSTVLNLIPKNTVGEKWVCL